MRVKIELWYSRFPKKNTTAIKEISDFRTRSEIEFLTELLNRRQIIKSAKYRNGGTKSITYTLIK